MLIELELGQSAIQVTPKDVPEDYCGSCYGAALDENQCCNTCEVVQDAYRKRGWTANPDIFEQVSTIQFRNLIPNF